VKLAIPLVAQGELVGVLFLGPRRSEQDYSADDKRLLERLAAQAAPAVRVAQLVRQQETEARERERMDQELRVARLIQENLLPKRAPEPPGWHLSAYYRPARQVGGDFYDFIELPAGRLGLVVGDVTDKGVPAALVMASTRSVLRAAAHDLTSPGDVLERVNEQLVPEMPPSMFVTCFYGVLDPTTGRIEYANAGHNLPYLRSSSGVVELRATGMPLGLLPGMSYEQKEAVVGPGGTLLLHSDGLAEAHDRRREMFGFPRLAALVADCAEGARLIDHLLTELARFTGPSWEQEDDVTLVVLQRSAFADMETTLDSFELPSEPGREREAMERVAAAVSPLVADPARLDRIKTAVAEAAMNAMEHGNSYDPSLSVHIRVVEAAGRLSVFVTDHGGGAEIPEAETPDIDAKLAGDQSPRGWGLFLIKNMTDDMRVTFDDTHHTIELVWDLASGRPASRDEEGGSDARV
jgi:serine phosphatase RsbU (regulator of sigma subunit)/anti-sigma regulatory factor (Ser/Thr protein kinase)